MSASAPNPYEVVLLWMYDACFDGTVMSERNAVLWFGAWVASLNDENEREGL